MVLGVVVALLDTARGRLGPWGGTLTPMAVTGVASSPEVAALSYDVADKAFSAQAAQWEVIRGRVTTLVTVGPAAAVVIVTATSPKFDLLALLALVFLVLAVGESIIAIWKGRSFHRSPALPAVLPPGTDATTLHVALALRTNELREKNAPKVKELEGMFLTAAAAFLLAVLIWSIHAATSSQVLFVLH